MFHHLKRLKQNKQNSRKIAIKTKTLNRKKRPKKHQKKLHLPQMKKSSILIQQRKEWKMKSRMEKEKSKKTLMPKKIWKFLSNTLTTLLFILLISATCLVLITRINGGEPEVFGHQLKVVLSGSMEPTFLTGSIIAVENYAQDRSLKTDDIITFMEDENKLITHRIIDIVETDEELLY